MAARLTALALIAVGAALAAHAAPAAPPSAVLVSFEQTGGFAAIERGLKVRRSGAVISDGLPVKVKQLSPTRLGTLRAALTASGFASLRDRYKSDEPVADGFVYRIGYGGNTVEIEQGAALPVRVARVFRLLRSLTYV